MEVKMEETDHKNEEETKNKLKGQILIENLSLTLKNSTEISSSYKHQHQQHNHKQNVKEE